MMTSSVRDVTQSNHLWCSERKIQIHKIGSISRKINQGLYKGHSHIILAWTWWAWFSFISFTKYFHISYLVWSSRHRWTAWQPRKSFRHVNSISRNFFFAAQCGNYGNSLSRIFGKNFVKVTVLILMESPKSYQIYYRCYADRFCWKIYNISSSQTTQRPGIFRQNCEISNALHTLLDIWRSTWRSFWCFFVRLTSISQKTFSTTFFQVGMICVYCIWHINHF